MGNPIAAPAGEQTLMERWVARYADDWVLFVQEVHGADPDAWQEQVLRDACEGREPRITIRSGHGTGKTAVLAWIIECAMLFRFPLRIVATAPTEKQLFDALYAEVKVWIGRLPKQIQQLFDIKSDNISLRSAPDESFFSVRTARAEKPEALAGVHCDSGWVFLICDEASGIAEAIFESGSGSMSGHNCTTILAGNPVRSAGLFFDSHHKLKQNPNDKRPGRWKAYHVNCETSGRVSKDFIEDMKARYGDASNAYRVRVLGEFPKGDDDTIIPLEMIEMSMMRDVFPIPGADTVWGVDVAYKGMDRSALSKRKGNALLERPKWKRGYDTMQTAGWIRDEWNQTPFADRPTEIMVDVIGYGAGVCNRLRELGLPAIGVNVSESPALTKAQYVNLRTEMWFEGADWFRARDCVMPARQRDSNGLIRDPDMDDFIEELAAQTYDRTSSGKTGATPKKVMYKTLGRSPDLAESFLLTFCGPAGRATLGSNSGSRAGSWGKPLKMNRKGIV